MNSRLDLRLEAVRLTSMIEGVSPDNFVETARKVEEYVLGSASLPEVYDQMEALKQATNFTFNNLKPFKDEKQGQTEGVA